MAFKLFNDRLGSIIESMPDLYFTAFHKEYILDSINDFLISINEAG